MLPPMEILPPPNPGCRSLPPPSLLSNCIGKQKVIKIWHVVYSSIPKSHLRVVEMPRPEPSRNLDSSLRGRRHWAQVVECGPARPTVDRAQRPQGARSVQPLVTLCNDSNQSLWYSSNFYKLVMYRACVRGYQEVVAGRIRSSPRRHLQVRPDHDRGSRRRSSGDRS